MSNNPATDQLESVLAKLTGDLLHVSHSMPTTALRNEMSRLATSLEKCVGSLHESSKQATEQVAKKREKNSEKAATNAKAIQQARAKLKSPPKPAPPNGQPNAIDASLGDKLRAELLSRVATPVVKVAPLEGARFVIEDWHWDESASGGMRTLPS
ncbi:hypothetical protein [Aeoliella mucimassa]|nr:hypothetical protein [Aeoliella mucimassa]